MVRRALIPIPSLQILFFDEVSVLTQRLASSDVQFHIPRARLRTTIAEAMDERSGIIPSAKKMRERCAKHFTAGVRDGLFGDVWLHVAAAFAAQNLPKSVSERPRP